MTQQMLQGTLADDAIDYIKTDPLYTGAEAEVKRDLLTKRLTDNITNTRAKARVLLRDWARRDANKQYRGDFNAYIRGEYKALSANEKEKAEQGWAIKAERYGFAGKTFAEALKEIGNLPPDQYDDMERDTRASILTLWFIQSGKDFSKALEESATQ